MKQSLFVLIAVALVSLSYFLFIATPTFEDSHDASRCRACDVLDTFHIIPNVLAQQSLLKMQLEDDRAIFLTFGSISMRDFIFNWHFQVRKTLPTQRTVMAALDNETFTFCNENTFACVSFPPETQMKSGGYWRQNENTFLSMATLKTTFLTAFITAGLNVWMSDLDVVWLASPWAWSGGTFLFRVPEAKLLQFADVISSTDIIRKADEMQGLGWLVDREQNTGIIFFRNTSNAIDLSKQWKVRLFEERNHSYKNDQATFNRMFDGGWSVALNPSLVPGETVIRGVFERHGVNLGNVAPLCGTLPMEVFLNGHTYFVQRLHEFYNVSPIAVHVTYIFGDTPSYSYGKRHRLREMQAWHVDADAYFNDVDVLAVDSYTLLDDDNTIQDVQVPVWISAAANRGTDTGIATHIHYMNKQRKRLAKLLLLGDRLKKTVVMPHLLAFCERHFWTLEACRVAGNNMSLPRTVPMDHLLEISNFYAQKINFRESGFLENPRFTAHDRVTLVSLHDIDAVCVHQTENNAFWRITSAMHIQIKYCGAEDWYIPVGGTWDPVKQPLNCTDAFDPPEVEFCETKITI
jgi:hypothetical protein